MPFRIKYKFQDDEEFHTCVMTYRGFQNFKELPIIKVCEIFKKDIKEYKKELQEEIDLAAKNDTSHIQKLSEIAVSNF